MALSTLIVASSAFIAQQKSTPKTLEVGTEATELQTSLKTLQGEDVMVRTLMGKQGLLVVFTCNTCPFVIAWEDRYNDIYDLCQKNGIEMILVNSNEAKRNGDDSPEAMKAHAEKMDYKAPYLIDANSDLANAWGAKTTPHVYLFDPAFKLRYIGAIDDNHENKTKVKATYLQNAIENLAAGKTIEPNNTKALGCSIKRV